MIESSPRFTLTRTSRPTAKLQTGQMTMVYDALTPHPVDRTLDELMEVIEQRFKKEYEERIKKPPLTRPFLRASIRYHLRRMIKFGMVRETF